MESVRVRQRVGPDGVLHLEIPVGIADQDLDVMVIYQPTALASGTEEGRESASSAAAKLSSIQKVQAILRKYVPEGQSLVAGQLRSLTRPSACLWATAPASLWACTLNIPS